MPRLATAALTLLLAGCVHTVQHAVTPPADGTTSYRTVEQPGMAHYQLALGQVATGATLDVRTAPVYPVAMLAACAPLVEVPARVIVGTDGRVGEVRIEPLPGRQPFAAAVRAAALGWRYAPLTITRWAADAAGESHPVDSATRPFSLDYVFTFRCQHGRTAVSAGAADGAH